MTEKDRIFDVTELQGKVRGRLVNGGSFLLMANLIAMGVSLIGQVIMARLLSPEAFGLIAMAMVIVNMAMVFKDFGFSSAIIQAKTITHTQVSQIFWVNLLLGLVIAGGLSASASAIAAFYGEERLVDLVRCLSVIFVIAPLGAQHLAILSRQMKFRAIAMINLASVLASLLVGVSAAAGMRSYWALMIMYLAYHLFSIVLSWSVLRWVPGIPSRHAKIMGLVKFGGNITGFNILNYFSMYIGNLLIGAKLGAVPLGFYDRAQALFMSPIKNLYRPLTSIMLPSLSRLVEQPVKYKKTYTGVLEKTSMMVMPLMAFSCVMGDWVVDFVLGSAWEEVGVLLSMFSILGITTCLSRPTGWLFTTQGRTNEFMIWGIVSSFIRIGAIAIGLLFGVKGVVLSYVAITVAVLLPGAVYLSGRKGPVSVLDQLQASWFPLLIAASIILVGYGLRMHALIPEGVFGLTAFSGVSALICSVCLFGLPKGRQIVRENISLAAELIRNARASFRKA